MKSTAPKIAYLTSGAAGMYCGSCMHDNSLARALTQLGADIQLIPTYTPIQTDEENVSVDRVFFGGINVFLQQNVPLFRFLPSFLMRILDRPRMLQWASKKGMKISAKKLGAMTVSMLRGSKGYQKQEVRKLCHWLHRSIQPDLINLSNMLIAGCVPAIKEKLDIPVLATLQGDDIFLNDLIEPYRSQALQQLSQLVPAIDGFIVNSQYYARYMCELLNIPDEKVHIVPLGLDTRDFESVDRSISPPDPRQVVIGYLARIAPEKGFHILVDAFVRLKQRSGTDHIKLRSAGWLGEHNREYLQKQLDKIEAAHLMEDFEYLGTVDRQAKLDFLQTVDLISVPTTYREPKGLFVLEALACGIPVVQPDHGAFPELISDTGGGCLVAPEDPAALADQLQFLATNADKRRELAAAGRQRVHAARNADAMGRATLAVYQKFLSQASKVVE